MEQSLSEFIINLTHRWLYERMRFGQYLHLAMAGGHKYEVQFEHQTNLLYVMTVREDGDLRYAVTVETWESPARVGIMVVTMGTDTGRVLPNFDGYDPKDFERHGILLHNPTHEEYFAALGQAIATGILVTFGDPLLDQQTVTDILHSMEGLNFSKVFTAPTALEASVLHFEGGLTVGTPLGRRVLPTRVFLSVPTSKRTTFTLRFAIRFGDHVYSTNYEETVTTAVKLVNRLNSARLAGATACDADDRDGLIRNISKAWGRCSEEGTRMHLWRMVGPWWDSVQGELDYTVPDAVWSAAHRLMEENSLI